MIKPPEEWTASERAWWDRWWREDYSWDGLAKKKWQGWRVGPKGEVRKERRGWLVGPKGEVKLRDEAAEGWEQANLTHYWMEQGVNPDPDGDDLFECVAPDGGTRKFTRCHLPYFDGIDRRTDKKDWDEAEIERFTDDLKKTLLNADATIEAWRGDWTDFRAQWQGVVAPRVPALGRDDAKQEIHLHAAGSHLNIGESWTFQVFGPHAQFNSVHFSGHAGFEYAHFGGVTIFVDARFGGFTWFDHAHFGGTTLFRDARFGGGAFFKGARFCEAAQFDDALFGGHAGFGGVYFLRDAVFTGAGPELKTADLVQDLVRDRTGDRIAQLKLKGGLTPLSANAFLNVDFSNCLFDGDAIFDNRDMLGSFSLSGAQFNGMTSFHGSEFHAGLSISGASFDGVLEITKKLKAKGKLDPLSDEIYADCWTGDKGDADGLNKFKQTNEEKRRKRFEKLIPSSIGQLLPSSTGKSKPFTQSAYNKNWNDIESAYGTMKQGMEALRRRTDEQDFYTMELRARRRRRGDPKVPYWERMASYIYQGVSNFGGSIARPIVYLVAAYFFFAAWYWGSAVAIDRDLRQSIRWEMWAPVHSSVEDALHLSGQLIFPPSILWSSEVFEKEPGAVVEALLEKPPFLVRVFARLIATIQSVFAIFMLFLTGLALRRRFQIN